MPMTKKRVVIEVSRGLMSIPRMDERIEIAFLHNPVVLAALGDASETAVDHALENWSLDGGTPFSQYGSMDSIDGGTL